MLRAELRLGPWLSAVLYCSWFFLGRVFLLLLLIFGRSCFCFWLCGFLVAFDVIRFFWLTVVIFLLLLRVLYISRLACNFAMGSCAAAGSAIFRRSLACGFGGFAPGSRSGFATVCRVFGFDCFKLGAIIAFRFLVVMCGLCFLVVVWVVLFFNFCVLRCVS